MITYEEDITHTAARRSGSRGKRFGGCGGSAIGTPERSGMRRRDSATTERGITSPGLGGGRTAIRLD